MSDQKVEQLNKQTFKKEFRFKNIVDESTFEHPTLHRHQTFFKIPKDYLEVADNDIKINVFNNILKASRVLNPEPPRKDPAISSNHAFRSFGDAYKKIVELYEKEDVETVVISVMASEGYPVGTRMKVEEYYPETVQDAKDWIREQHNFENVNDFPNSVFTFVFCKNPKNDAMKVTDWFKEKYNYGACLSNNDDFLGYSYEICIDLNNQTKKNIDNIIEMFNNYKTQVKYKKETQKFLKKNKKFVRQTYKRPRSIRIYTDKVSIIHKLKIAGISYRNVTINVSQKALNEWDN